MHYTVIDTFLDSLLKSLTSKEARTKCFMNDFIKECKFINHFST